MPRILHHPISPRRRRRRRSRSIPILPSTPTPLLLLQLPLLLLWWSLALSLLSPTLPVPPLSPPRFSLPLPLPRGVTASTPSSSSSRNERSSPSKEGRRRRPFPPRRSRRRHDDDDCDCDCDCDCCDVYVLVTPLGNSIGRATAEALVRQLRDESAGDDSKTTTTSVVCLVRYPSSSSSSSEKKKTTRTTTRTTTAGGFGFQRRGTSGGGGGRHGRELPASTSSSSSTRVFVEELDFDFDFDEENDDDDDDDDFRREPVGGGAFSPPGGDRFLDRILERVSLAIARRRRHHHRSSSGDGAAPDPVVRIRGLLINPYGCPPPTTTTTTTNTDGLAAYKVLSVADLVEAALRRHRHRRGGEAEETLRVILVGTEAARGLPRMGIPVPDLADATPDTIRRMLLPTTTTTTPGGGEDDDENENDDDESSLLRWEEDYAAANALAVLYLKAVAGEHLRRDRRGDRRDHRDRGGRGRFVYLGAVSPGMTPESFRIEHVPVRARTLRFRLKLWLCGRPIVFGKLLREEIAKTTEDAGHLLATALRNGPLPAALPDDDDDTAAAVTSPLPPRRWDDVYPSGSFVGARSGTGGPLCEQSLTVLDASTGTVRLPPPSSGAGDDDDENAATTTTTTKTTNFLADRRLQAIVREAVRDVLRFPDDRHRRRPRRRHRDGRR